MAKRKRLAAPRRRHKFTVLLSDAEYARLQALMTQQGQAASDLVRQWIMGHD